MNTHPIGNDEYSYTQEFIVQDVFPLIGTHMTYIANIQAGQVLTTSHDGLQCLAKGHSKWSRMSTDTVPMAADKPHQPVNPKFPSTNLGRKQCSMP